MSKAVMISIRPKWCERIASGKKTIEVRKNKPKLNPPFKCYIYCTDGPMMYSAEINYGRKMVIGEFVCDKITYLGNISTDPWEFLHGSTHEYHKMLVTKQARLTEHELREYGGKYAWHISDLVIYDHPQPLNWFVTEGDCDCSHCRECSWFNRGNGYNVEDDCDLGYEAIYRKEPLKPLFRAPQSWCYVEDLGPKDGE